MHAKGSFIRLAMACSLLGLTFAGCGRPLGGAPGGDGRDAASHFLGELRAGHLEPAWQETTPDFKSLMGLENLRDYVKRHPALKGPAEYAESRDAARDGRPMVEHVFKAQAHTRGKTVPATVKVLVAAENGGWGVGHVTVE